MSYQGVRHGALTVVEQPRAKDEINTRLRLLHEGLFCERQLREGDFGFTYPVWCVCLDTGPGGIATVYEWRDPQGQPIPHLSDRLVAEMERRYKRGPVTMAAITRENEEHAQAGKAQFRREIEQLVEEAKHMGTRLPVFHRSQRLRMTRDRMRRGN